MNKCEALTVSKRLTLIVGLDQSHEQFGRDIILRDYTIFRVLFAQEREKFVNRRRRTLFLCPQRYLGRGHEKIENISK